MSDKASDYPYLKMSHLGSKVSSGRPRPVFACQKRRLIPDLLPFLPGSASRYATPDTNSTPYSDTMYHGWTEISKNTMTSSGKNALRRFGSAVAPYGGKPRSCIPPQRYTFRIRMDNSATIATNSNNSVRRRRTACYSLSRTMSVSRHHMSCMRVCLQLSKRS